MKKSNTDYFTLKTAPLRGSSPTSSLAADLSQNFHIDQSPQLPTPRRSLFTNALFGARQDREGATTPPSSWEGATTPPILSSSPGYAPESMDISPLPHKKPSFSFSRPNFQLQVLPPAETKDEDMTSPPADTPPKLQVPERKRSQFLRPSLSRTRCLSSTSIGQLTKTLDNQLPAFTFGAGGMGSNGSCTASTPSLDEAFKASPPQEKNPFDRTMVVPPRPRSLLHNANRGGGSPISVSVKRATNPTARPRKQFRRSLSMFESPGDVMKQEKNYVPSGLGSIMDVDEGSTGLRLPHFFPADNRPEHGSLPRINHDTMVHVLDGHFQDVYDSVLIVDCRFEYEYEGGHILGAENYNDKEQLSHRLFESCPTSNALIILHCEYSNHRAPLMAAYLRKQDRAVNAVNYPHLSYPDLYILDGGYCSFFDSYRPRCFPQNYLRMDDEAYIGACERGLGKIKQRAKLSRAQTFAFGQGSQMDDSPSRPSINIIGPTEMDLAAPTRVQNRRMASY
ncbi:hypothetical protein FKW77_009505 [Venturia effusa]|uniref:M-phase inducer phosphatase n=1 Tax=Venturia effusa TaxID=50376 RepID=A0A517L841_9PEZI|nr:hypothetical protein FKW77_009505 [Venturia effusa]